MAYIQHVDEMGSWRARGLCTTPEFEWAAEYFFAPTPAGRRTARNICMSCPVREECLVWALNRPEIWGVWGGLDEGELRRALGVDHNGHVRHRIRPPHCPRCRCRPGNLFVASCCELPAGRRREWVQCAQCGFTWGAATSVAAVRAYWRERKKRNRELELERRAKVSALEREARAINASRPSSPAA